MPCRYHQQGGTASGGPASAMPRFRSPVASAMPRFRSPVLPHSRAGAVIPLWLRHHLRSDCCQCQSAGQRDVPAMAALRSRAVPSWRTQRDLGGCLIPAQILVVFPFPSRPILLAKQHQLNNPTNSLFITNRRIQRNVHESSHLSEGDPAALQT